MWALAQQPGRKLTPAVPTTGRAMAKFSDIQALQTFAAVHASIHNHFNQDRHLNHRDIFKQNRSVALAEWRELAA